MVTIYRVRRAVPVVRPVITNRQQLRELRARKLANQGLSDTQQQTRHVIHNNGTHTNTGISNEEGGTSW
jgi:histone acetyltransferase (RNA polymerase elongator complex component)